MFDYHKDFYGALPLHATITRYDFTTGDLPVWVKSSPKCVPIWIHNHEAPEFIYVTKGSMTIEVNGDRATLSEGDLMLISPCDLHLAEFADKTKPLEYCCVIFELSILNGCGKTVDQMLTELRGGTRRFPITLTGTPAREAGTQMLTIEHLKNSPAPQNTIPDLELSAAVCRLMSISLAASFPVTSTSNSDCLAFIRSVNRYIHIHLTENITTAQISSALGFSKGYFCALFKRSFGTTFTEHLRAQRIRAAIEKHISDNLSLSETAASVGFSDYAYFSRCFKKYAGIAPSKYFK